MSLATDYRPAALDQVIGQDSAIAALRGLDRPKALMIEGPSGCGKTTLARIVASEMLGVPQPTEYNGSERTQIDAWRETIREQAFATITGHPRVIIVDECQDLSKASWSALLKPVEDAPEGWHWIFCTTDPQKIPIANRNRCHRITVQRLALPALEQVIEAAYRSLVIDLPDRALVRLAAKEADGCARQALQNIELIEGAGGIENAKAILEAEDEEHDGPGKLCRALAAGNLNSFDDARQILGNFTASQAMKIRERVANYMATVAWKSGDMRHLTVLEAFAEPYPPDTARASLVLSLAEVIYAD